MFYLMGFLGLRPGDSISSNPERTALRRWEVGSSQVYAEVLQHRAGSGDLSERRDHC